MSTLRLPTTVEAILDELDSHTRTGNHHLALSDLMDFYSPITVHEDGTVTDGPAGVYAPTLYDDELSPSDRWSLLDGYSGQHGYSGPIMHNSEFIGGRMARDILAEPGTYVAVVAYWPPTCVLCGESIMEDDNGEVFHEGERVGESDHEACESDGADGWAVARLTD